MSETVLDGALVPFDPNDVRVIQMDWETNNLAAGVTIATSTWTISPVKPAALSVSSITRSSTTATVTTAAAHGLSTGDWVTIAGASDSDYNITAQITVTTTTAFTYTVAGSPDTPATGTITYCAGLGKDNESILSAAGYDSLWTQVRLTAGGEDFLGRRFEVANKVVTDESPTQTKERSFYVIVENQ